MIKCIEIDMQESCTPEILDNFMANVGGVIHSAHHIVLKSTPGAAIFG